MLRLSERRCDHLTRQREINRTARFRRRDREGAVDHRRELLAISQLIVPFDDLADHAGLIVHLLGPVNVAVARSQQAGFRKRRSARGQENATFSRAAFMAAQTMFAVPTLTCTITAGIRRDTMP